MEEPIHTPSNLSGIAYLYGHPLLNSLSPPLHQTVYNKLNLNWTQIPLSSITDLTATITYPPPYTRSPPIPKFLDAIRNNDRFVGSSVTMPWKVAIMSEGLLDDLTEDARMAGACNTIYVRRNTTTGKKELVGTNTDCIGIRETLAQNALPTLSQTGEEPYRGKPALIIGGGGTARTAIYVLRKWLRSSKIYIVNRDAGEVATILSEDAARSTDPKKAPLVHITESVVAESLQRPAAIISGIPNYPPKTPEEIKARQVIQAFLGGDPMTGDTYKGVILEMCYHPVPWTEIAALAGKAGWKVVLGSEALIWQGLEQARLWTGRDVVGVPGVVEGVKEVVAKSIATRAPKSNL